MVTFAIPFQRYLFDGADSQTFVTTRHRQLVRWSTYQNNHKQLMVKVISIKKNKIYNLTLTFKELNVSRYTNEMELSIA